MMRFLTLILVLLVVVVGLSFGSLNSKLVEVNYFLGSGQFELSLVIVLAFAVGILVAMMFAAFALVRSRHDVRRAQRESRRMEKELNNLRNAPIKDLS